MTISNGYATLAEFKSWVTVRGGTISTDTADDAVMEIIIEAVSREIDKLSRRHFYSASAATRYFTPEHPNVLFCDDIATATSLTIYTDDDGDGTYENTWAATDYHLEPINAVNGWPFMWIERAVFGNYSFPIIPRGVKITGTFGWAAVPTDIKMACLVICHNVWMGRSGQTGSGRVSVTAGGVVIRPEDIPDHVMQTLTNYRRLV